MRQKEGASLWGLDATRSPSRGGHVTLGAQFLYAFRTGSACGHHGSVHLWGGAILPPLTVIYTVQKAWKGLHFLMPGLKKGNKNKNRLAYTLLVRPILENLYACWYSCRGQINVLDLVKKKAAQFTNHTKDSDRQTLAERRTIACLCALLKAYTGERSWKAIRDRLRRAYYLSRLDHFRKLGTGIKEQISESISS